MLLATPSRTFELLFLSSYNSLIQSHGKEKPKLSLNKITLF